jgi:hypothetical protein
MNRLMLLLFFLVFIQCRPEIPEEVPLPTKICVQTLHHTVPIPHAIIYLKYNVDTFPGYHQPPSYYDATFRTGADARGCIAPVPEGRHWLVAFGYDSLYFPHYVYGSLRAEISLHYKPVLDTVLYISE